MLAELHVEHDRGAELQLEAVCLLETAAEVLRQTPIRVGDLERARGLVAKALREAQELEAHLVATSDASRAFLAALARRSASR